MKNEELQLWKPFCINYNALVLVGHSTFIFFFPLLAQLKISLVIHSAPAYLVKSNSTQSSQKGPQLGCFWLHLRVNTGPKQEHSR